jgi:hypothetical protein
MGTYVLKAERENDLYVGWSTVVDNLVWIATSRDGALRQPDVAADRLDRADEMGTSSLLLSHGWHDDGMIVANMERDDWPFAWLHRSDLAEYARRYLGDDVAGAEALLCALNEDGTVASR